MDERINIFYNKIGYHSTNPMGLSQLKKDTKWIDELIVKMRKKTYNDIMKVNPIKISDDMLNDLYIYDDLVFENHDVIFNLNSIYDYLVLLKYLDNGDKEESLNDMELIKKMIGKVRSVLSDHKNTLNISRKFDYTNILLNPINSEKYLHLLSVSRSSEEEYIGDPLKILDSVFPNTGLVSDDHIKSKTYADSIDDVHKTLLNAGIYVHYIDIPNLDSGFISYNDLYDDSLLNRDTYMRILSYQRSKKHITNREYNKLRVVHKENTNSNDNKYDVIARRAKPYDNIKIKFLDSYNIKNVKIKNISIYNEKRTTIDIDKIQGIDKILIIGRTKINKNYVYNLLTQLGKNTVKIFEYTKLDSPMKYNILFNILNNIAS